MKKHLIKNKAVFVIIQLLIVLLLFEIGFRVAGFMKLNLLSPGANIEKGVFVILCVGDSTTEGLMVSRAYSYPSQLQRILDKEAPDRKFRVINIGNGGMNSSQVLNRFEANILKYRPNLIVLLAGINDSWNMNESNIWMFERSDFLNRLKLRADLFFSKLRVYQFIKLLALSKRQAHLIPLDEGKQQLARSFERSGEKGKQLYALLSYNINQMVDLAKKYAVPIFLQTYQKEGMGNTRMWLNKVYEKVDVPIVDNQEAFALAAERNLNLISRDNFHPNENGYALIAKNVYNMMVKQKIMNSRELPLF